MTKDKFVSADKSYDIECVSSGSKPAAQLTWWRDNKQIKRLIKNVSAFDFGETIFHQYLICAFMNTIISQQYSEQPDNKSLSVLTYIPSVEDDGKYLTCRSENTFIENSAIEDKWRLVVHCEY